MSLPPVLPSGVKIERVILLFEGGSRLHGVKIAGQDDTDIYGVYIESLEALFGPRAEPHVIDSTGPKDAPNSATDTDWVFYSLRKLTALLMKGNPTIFQFLFVETPYLQRDARWPDWAERFRSLALHRGLLWSYVGYGRAQLQRLLGERGQKRCRRADLEDQYGYDVKYAAHALRLIHEGWMVLRDGRLWLPLEGLPLQECLAILTGQIPKAAAVTLIERHLAEFHQAVMNGERELPTAAQAAPGLIRVCADATKEFYGIRL